MEERKRITDAEYIAQWRAMLKIFYEIKHDDPEAKVKYLELQQSATNTPYLTPRQKEGIFDRCAYQMMLLGNPSLKPFANSLRKEDRNAYQLSNTESNGKP